MKRLEFTRRMRSAPGLCRNAAEAVTHLAHIARERHRLDQERKTLMQRVTRIDARLGAIAATETRLMPFIQADAGRSKDPAPEPAIAPPKRPALPVGLGELTLQY